MIPITRPFLGEEEVTAAAAVIRSGWLTQGERVEEFETAIARYVGAGRAVAVSNCTTALHLALLAAGVGPGDEVICPSFSFIATANAIVHAGARPVFVDIDPYTYNIDPELVEAAITPRTRAVMPVDQIGLAADIMSIRVIAKRHGLKVVEDAAPSLGSMVGGRRVGSLSDLTCFSFHPRKSITTGEGGVITTDDPDTAMLLNRIRSHGASTSDLNRYRSKTVRFEEYRELGYNYRLTDIQAAIGIAQLRKLDSILAERRRLAARYARLLGDCEWLQLPFEPPARLHTYQSYCVRVRSRDQREAIMADLAGRGIATRRGVMAIHLEPFYRDLCPDVSLPVTERCSAETLLLPLFPGLTAEEQELVADSLLRAGAEADMSGGVTVRQDEFVG
ncbi:MAG TPA: DegT/DnrJ/EryC1/StrS family aminotransferase [Candidatus Micrarchaeaceae archaeon]|nr:DegT/DnrJ/EryC1/StrS family aminotransferase [Candidatus Micrarchaeaceae archaeon]